MLFGAFRSEWGFSHEMADLGLEPLTHHNAVIEAIGGYVEIKFKCTKSPVNIAYVYITLLNR